MTDQACPHILAVERVTLAKKRECEACAQIGARWVHLRTCQACGATLCCDASPNQHASKHARALVITRGSQGALGCARATCGSQT